MQGCSGIARRGASELRSPVGLRRQPDGTVVLDPDEQVHKRSFQAEGLLMPCFVQDGTDLGHLVWVRPIYQMLTQVLTNRDYAGMFVYGRRVQQTRAGDPPHRFGHGLTEEEWEIVVSGVYLAYISEEQYARRYDALDLENPLAVASHNAPAYQAIAKKQHQTTCYRFCLQP